MIRNAPRAALLLFLAACGGEEQPATTTDVDSGTDVGSEPTDVATDARQDGGADVAPIDAAADADVASEPEVVEGLPIPFQEHIGPCTRQVHVGTEQTLLFRYEFDYSDAPAVVTARRYAGEEFNLAVDFIDVDTRRSCAKPPDERHGAFVDIVGCPARTIIDTGDNGLISPQDLAASYTYDESGNLIASDHFDWRNNFTGSAWFFEYNLEGALLGGERLDSGATAVSMVASYPGDSVMVLTIDDGADDTVDEIATYQFDDGGNLLDQTVEQADPATGELSLRSRSSYTYECWD